MPTNARQLKKRIRIERSVNRFRQHYGDFSQSVDYTERAEEIIAIARTALHRDEKARLLELLVAELGSNEAVSEVTRDDRTQNRVVRHVNSQSRNFDNLPRAKSAPAPSADGVSILPFIGREQITKQN